MQDGIRLFIKDGIRMVITEQHQAVLYRMASGWLLLAGVTLFTVK